MPHPSQCPYRVVSLVNSNTVILTGPEHAELGDVELIEAALTEAKRVGLTVSRGELRIIWAPALGGVDSVL
ncbi:MAG: hypothetical protein WCK28_13145 [Burkholderiales bacterium]